MTLQPGARAELQVDGLSSSGDGVGRLDGRVIFVPRAAPGDRVRVEVESVHRRFARARLLELLAPGAGRREAPCPYYARCGGCTWMHLTVEAQRDARIEILSDALARLGGIRALPVVEWIASPAELGYRARARIVRQGARIGFRAYRSHDVVDVEHCLVLDAPTQAELDALRRSPRRDHDEEIPIRGFGNEVEGLVVSPRSFFQANRLLWKKWRETVAEVCGTGKLLVELYAGVGFYTPLLETRFERVIAVERAESARDLAKNCSAQVIHSSVEDYSQTLRTLSPDVVLMNPPRAGCSVEVVNAVLASRPQRVVYVSCDPPTLARDTKRLSERYRVVRVFAIDSNPNSHRIEAMLVLDSFDDDRRCA